MKHPTAWKTLARDASDEELLSALTAELQRRLPVSVQQEYPAYVAALQQQPRGLRAMAATHRLDVSLAMDDLGWHFYNFHDRAYVQETLLGLQELEAVEAAVIFQSAYDLVSPYWDEIGRLKHGPEGAFGKWFGKSALAQALDPLNVRLRAICDENPNGLMEYWLAYARKYPERLDDPLKRN